MPANHDARDAAVRAELLKSAKSILPLLRKNAERAERERRIPAENIAAMEQAGLFRILVPQKYGGLGALAVKFVVDGVKAVLAR